MMTSGPSDSVAWSRNRCGIVSWMFCSVLSDSSQAGMILPVQRNVRTRIAETVTRLYGIATDDPILAGIAVDVPPRRALGDLAVPLAFELARRLRKAPRAIAQEIAAAIGEVEGVSRIEAAPNGYLNFFLDRV